MTFSRTEHIFRSIGDEEGSHFLTKSLTKALPNLLHGTVEADETYIGGKKHTDLYFAELDYKYNTRKLSGGVRTAEEIQMIKGRQLILRRPKGGK